MLRAAPLFLLSLLVITPFTAYGFSTVVETINASWKKQTVTVCISNNAEPYFEDLFMDAVNTWGSVWSHLSYRFADASEEDDCDITAYIVRAYASLTSSGHVGVAEVRHSGSGAITGANILIPTEVELKDGDVKRMTSTSFYRVALHEFGHTLGLLHAKDENYEEPVDIMAPILTSDGTKMEISELDVNTLNRLYDVETEFVPLPEKELEPLPTPSPSPLPEALQEMQIRIERATYYSNETLRIDARPPSVVSGIEANIILYHAHGREKVVLHAAPDSDGEISVSVPLESMKPGIWSVKISYVSWVSETAFALKQVESSQAKTTVRTELSISTERTEYNPGDTVEFQVSASGSSGWYIDVFDPRGSNFMKINPSSMKAESDRMYHASFQISEHGLAGIWRINAVSAGDGTELAGAAIHVVADEEDQVKVQVQGKQIKDLVLLRLRNMGETGEVHRIVVNSSLQVIQACKGTNWTVEDCASESASLNTDGHPVVPGEKAYLRFKVQNSLDTLSWKAFDDDGNLLDSGTALIMLR